MVNSSAQNFESLFPQPPRGYQIFTTLGKGGMGAVYQVMDLQNNRRLALKVLLENKATPYYRERFLREIRITSNLEHPHIIPIYESGRLDSGDFYFVMKEIAKDFNNVLHPVEGECSYPLEKRLEGFIQICEALEYAHSRGVIHRDLKPSNLGVDEFGSVLVMDWGIAGALGERDLVDPQDTAVRLQAGFQGDLTRGSLGSPGYMAPEQAKGEDVDERSDIFSLGAILYEMLCLKAAIKIPPRKQSEDPRAYSQRISHYMTTHEPPPPHKIDPSVSRDLSAIALKALSKNPKDRYQKVKELREDLRLYQMDFSVSAKRDNLLEQCTKWVRRNKVLTLTFTAALLVILLVLLGVRIFHRREVRRQWQKHFEKASQYLQDAEKLEKTLGKILRPCPG